jgi:diketogulonate reductase-like aldo/keto reductase
LKYDAAVSIRRQPCRRSGIARDDMFLVTKIWVSDFGRDAEVRALWNAGFLRTIV